MHIHVYILFPVLGKSILKIVINELNIEMLYQYSSISLYYSIIHNCSVLDSLTILKVVNIFVKSNNSRYTDILQFFSKLT